MMRSRFDEQLAQLHRELIEMGALCERVIALASRALTTGDKSLAQQVPPLDRDIDRKERDIENLCLRLLLHQQPVAGDLRRISAALKMITDMERIGDQADDIAEIVLYLEDVPAESHELLRKMAEAAIGMVSDSVDAYVRQDVALAEKVAGVTELFVEQMNNRARGLGMDDTHFVNPTGLTAEGHVTSAHDIALMSRELLLHHPDIRRFTTIWMDTIRDGAFQLANTNKLIRFYDGATGLKTGYTASAGYCISATAERDGMELIAVIMKAPDKDTRTKDAKALLNYGFSTYALVDALPPEPLTPVAVAMGASDAVQPVPEAENTSVLVEKAKAGGLTRTVTLEPQVAAPVEAGQRLGELSVLDGGTVLLTVPLVAEEAVARRSWGQVFTQLLRMAVFAA